MLRPAGWFTTGSGCRRRAGDAVQSSRFISDVLPPSLLDDSVDWWSDFEGDSPADVTPDLSARLDALSERVLRMHFDLERLRAHLATGFPDQPPAVPA